MTTVIAGPPRSQAPDPSAVRARSSSAKDLRMPHLSRISRAARIPAASGDDGPDGFDHSEGPRSLEETVGGSETARSGERQDEPGASVFESVADEHRGHREQTEERQPVHDSPRLRSAERFGQAVAQGFGMRTVLLIMSEPEITKSSTSGCRLKGPRLTTPSGSSAPVRPRHASPTIKRTSSVLV